MELQVTFLKVDWLTPFHLYTIIDFYEGTVWWAGYYQQKQQKQQKPDQCLTMWAHRFQAQANVFKDWIQMKAFRNTLQLNNYEIQDVFLFRRSLILLWWYDFIVMWTSEPLPFNTDQSGAVKKLNKFQYFALNNIHKQMKKTWNALEFTGTKWEGLKILLMQSNTRCIGWFEHLNFKKHYFQMT